MSPTRAEPVTQWLTIVVNHALREGFWACRVEGDSLWLARQDLPSLGLAPPPGTDKWIALQTLPGVKGRFDSLSQQLTLDASADALAGQQHLVSDAPVSHPQFPQAETVSAVTLAYSLYASDAYGERQASAQTTLTASGNYPGQFSSGFYSHTNDDRLTHTRLMSRWQWDQLSSLISLALGDSITTGASWSRQVRFGGLHLARNFQLDPQLNTAPRAQYSDTAVLPSTVDLWVDGLKQSSQKVTPGDYRLDTLPTFTGNGVAQVVVTDINGQRRSVSLDLYGAPGMLASGLSSGSLDIGWMRQNYAQRSDDYAGAPMLDAGWRYGLNNHLTLGLHTEQQRTLRNAGVGSDWLVSPYLGIISQHMAASDSRYGRGVKWGLGWQWSGSGMSFSASTARSEKNYADNARLAGVLPVRRSDTFWASRAFGRAGTLGVGLVRQTLARSDSRYLNTSWSVALPAQISTSLSYTRSLSVHEHTVQLSLTIPLGRRDTVSLQHGSDATRWDYRRQPDNQQGGWSWQMGQSLGDSAEKYLDVGHLGNYGEWHVGVDRGKQYRSQYASGEGSLTLLDGSLHALRYNQQGLALVSTNGVGHIPMMLENRPAGETDDNGYLLLTDLPRYHNSKVTIDPLALPADVLTPVTDIYARPGTTEAVKVVFDVHPAVTLQARLTDRNHQPLPMGSVVSTSRASTIVGRDGFIWLEDPDLPGELHVQTPDGTCRVSLPASASTGRQLNIGEQPCL